MTVQEYGTVLALINFNKYSRQIRKKIRNKFQNKQFNNLKNSSLNSHYV